MDKVCQKGQEITSKAFVGPASGKQRQQLRERIDMITDALNRAQVELQEAYLEKKVIMEEYHDKPIPKEFKLKRVGKKIDNLLKNKAKLKEILEMLHEVLEKY